MKGSLKEIIQIPSGISCEYSKGMLICRKGSDELKKKFDIPKVSFSVRGDSVVIESLKANKNQHKIIKSSVAHIKNLFDGINKKFVYRLETANVHFPMTLKLDGKVLIISNFLGEKVPRKAKILPNVNVELKGASIIVTSHDKEAAGQTAGNIEKATKVKGYDKRVFQDGIYITQKPGDEK